MELKLMLIIYIIGWVCTYYLTKKWANRIWPDQERDWADVYFSLMVSVIWPIGLPLCALLMPHNNKPPKWL